MNFKKEPPTVWSGVLCWHYLSSRGSDTSAVGGRISDWSEWPWPTDEDGVSSPTKLSGATTGSPPSIVGANELNFCVRDGERRERRLRRNK